MQSSRPSWLLPDQEVPSALVDSGWIQGAIIQSPITDYAFAGIDESQADYELAIRCGPTPSKGIFVVVSQTCDIAAALDREPIVEAFPCSIERNPTTRASYRNSFRWFEIDRQSGLVAHAMYRVCFDKRALLQLPPSPWPDTSERLKLFSRWIGRRASRSAIENPVVKNFVAPLKKTLDRMQKHDAGAYLAFNASVQEIRIRPPSENEAPFTVNMLLVIDSSGISGDGDDAIEKVLAGLRSRLEKTGQARLEDVLKLTTDRISMDLYFNTSQIDFDSVTYEGDEISGAEPPPI